MLMALWLVRMALYPLAIWLFKPVGILV